MKRQHEMVLQEWSKRSAEHRLGPRSTLAGGIFVAETHHSLALLFSAERSPNEHRGGALLLPAAMAAVTRDAAEHCASIKSSKTSLLRFARLAEMAERYADMAHAMVLLMETANGQPLNCTWVAAGMTSLQPWRSLWTLACSVEERALFSAAFKHVTGALRDSHRAASALIAHSPRSDEVRFSCVHAFCHDG